MQQRKKILVIPSWYPNKEQTYGGSFFREQSEFFLQKYDVRVLVGSRSSLPLNKWCKKYGLGHASPSEVEVTQAGLQEHRFCYRTTFKDEKHLIGSMIQGYIETLKRMIGDGWKPDLIHAGCTDPAGIVAASFSKTFTIPWVLSEHQVFALGNYSPYRAKLMRRAIKSETMVTVVSQHQLRAFVAHYIYRSLIVTGNLVDEKKFQLVTSHSKKPVFNIMTVMYPSPIKDPETFFKAIAEIASIGHKNIEVTIIGKELFSRDNVDKFTRYINQYKLETLCTVIPYVRNDELAEYYSKADVFVSTSLAETFGIAVREAMMVGIPVVCTSSGGVDDDIFDFNGFRVDIYDYKAIANAVIKIKEGTVRYDPTVIRNHVLTKYGRKAFLEKMSEIFEAALEKAEA
ncbi:MAG: glycosyltransferase family 4 protein [Smithella sp.]|nr:glycosyltransferase family 4 protein [Smithella sp.]